MTGLSVLFTVIVIAGAMYLMRYSHNALLGKPFEGPMAVMAVFALFYFLLGMTMLAAIVLRSLQ